MIAFGRSVDRVEDGQEGHGSTMVKRLTFGNFPGGATSSSLATLVGGEVSEWFMVPFSKSGVQRCTGSSNLPLSATEGIRKARSMDRASCCLDGRTTKERRAPRFTCLGAGPTVSIQRMICRRRSHGNGRVVLGLRVLRDPSCHRGSPCATVNAPRRPPGGAAHECAGVGGPACRPCAGEGKRQRGGQAGSCPARACNRADWTGA